MSNEKTKIGIVTLPFNTNYGGLLQSYALQQVLKKMGHVSMTVYRETEGMPLKMKILSFGRRFILRYIFQKKVPVRSWPNSKEVKLIAQHTNRFLKENIALTHLLQTEKEFNDLGKYGFNAFIVGSDQVWRPKYSPRIKNHFLGFLNENSKVKRISYAASFGVAHWEYSPEQTEECSKLAQLFDAVSVREDSAVALCSNYLRVEAKHHIDPTMLVPIEEYIALVEKDGIKPMPGSLFNYVLDITPGKQEFINKISASLGLVAFSSTAAGSFRDLGKERLEQCIFPPVTNWIRGFMDAEFVITDSFHGTVFSIIFNKQFIAIGNKKRGMSRFSSLLKMFEIENRLVDASDLKMEEILRNPIDYHKVNKILEIKKMEAIKYLQDALS